MEFELVSYNVAALRWLFLYIAPFRVFTPALAYGFLQEFEIKQVSSSLHDSTQYSGRS